jgi:hypothetical protein
MNGQGSSNQQQARPTVGPAALTPRVRRELEQRANVFSEDGSVIVTQTARGKALRANLADVVATLSWNPDTLIAVINFNYQLILPGGNTLRNSAHDYQSTLDTAPGGRIPEGATSNTIQGQYTIDLSAVPTSQYGIISFYIPNYHLDAFGNQVWGIPGFDDPLILMDNYTDGTNIVATRTYTVDGVETVGEAVDVRHRNSHTRFGDDALEAYREGRDAFSTGHHYLCSLVVDVLLVVGLPVKAWLFGQQGKVRTLQHNYLGFKWNPGTLRVTIGFDNNIDRWLSSKFVPTGPATPEIVDAYTYVLPSATTTNPGGIAIGLYYDDAIGTLVFGSVPIAGQVGVFRVMLGFELVDGEITYITSGVVSDWHPSMTVKIAPHGALLRSYEMHKKYINGSGNRQLDTVTFDGFSGRAYFVDQDEDTTTPDETVDVFVASGANKGKRMRLTMVGDDLYTVASRTSPTNQVNITLDEDGGGVAVLTLYNTGAIIPRSSSSFTFI